MKNFRRAIILVFLLFAGLSHLLAQDKQDIITMVNGDKKTGKVKAIKENVVVFTYSGESLEYEFKKSEINKIDFASGRTETFTAASAQPEKNATAGSLPASRKNKVAVLPFQIQTNDQGLTGESLSMQIQQSCISALKEQSPSQIIQDPFITNNILSKNQFSASNIAMHTPQEWADILGVEYVIIGTYSIQNKGTSSYGSGVSSVTGKKSDDKSKATVVSSGNSYTTTDYNTRVSLMIYNDNGEQMFSDSRAPMFGSVDSYKSAVKTLVKKTFFGKQK